MPPAFVQKIDNTVFGATPSTSTTLLYPSNNTAGDLLIALASWFNATQSAGNVTTVTVTDSQGNVWTALPQRSNNGTPNGGTEVVQLWYALNCKGGANTVTFTFSPANGATFAGVFVGEWSGVDAIDNFDNEANGIYFGTSGTALKSTNGQSQAAATHDANGLVIAYGESSVFQTWSVSAPWTLRTSAGNASTNIQIGLADQVAGPGSFFASFTVTNSVNSWAVGTVTFYKKAATQFVQEIDHDDGVVTPRVTDSMTFTVPNTGGNLLFLNYVWLGNSGGNITISSITDTLGNTWVLLPRVTIDATTGPGGFGPTFGQAAYCLNCKAGANTVTVTFSSTGATFVGGSISEWTGVDTLDTGAGAGFAQGAIHSATATSPSITTTMKNALLIGFAQTEDGFVTMTPQAGFTPRTANLRSIWLQSEYNQAPGTYTSTVTGNGGNNGTNLWNSGIIAFAKKPSPPPSPGTLRPGFKFTF